jgi:hypothetical protein
MAVNFQSEISSRQLPRYLLVENIADGFAALDGLPATAFAVLAMPRA